MDCLEYGVDTTFLHSCNNGVSVKGNRERVVSLLEGSTKVLAISRVLSAHGELTECRVINRQEAELIPLVDIGLTCAGGRFGLWACHHFST